MSLIVCVSQAPRLTLRQDRIDKTPLSGIKIEDRVDRVDRLDMSGRPPHGPLTRAFMSRVSTVDTPSRDCPGCPGCPPVLLFLVRRELFLRIILTPLSPVPQPYPRVGMSPLACDVELGARNVAMLRQPLEESV